MDITQTTTNPTATHTKNNEAIFHVQQFFFGGRFDDDVDSIKLSYSNCCCASD